MMVRRFILTCLLIVTLPAAAEAFTLEECDERVRQAPEDPGSYYCIVLAARSSGRMEEAIQRLEAVLKERPDLHAARVDLAYLEHDLGRDQAEASYLQGIEGMEEAGDAWGLVYSHTGLASFLGTRQRFDEAEPHIARAMEVAAASGDGVMLAHARTRAAILADSRLDYGEALRLFRLAEGAVFPDGPAYLRGWILSGIGRIHWALGQHGMALATYQRGAELSRETGDRFGEAGMRYNVAFMAGQLWEGGGLPRSRLIELVNKAVDAAVESGNPGLEGSSRLLLGQAMTGPEAVEQLRRARSLIESAGRRQELLLARRFLAKKIFDSGPEREEEGLRLVDEVVADAREVRDRHSEAQGLILRATLLRDALYQRDRAAIIGAHEDAIAAVERIRDLQPEGSIRARSFSQWVFTYRSFVGYLLRELADSPDPDADLELAFGILERVRARVLLDTLDGAGVTAERAEMPGHAEREAVLSRIADAQTRLQEDGLTPTERRELLASLKSLEAEERELRSRAGRDESLSRSQGPATAVTLSRIRKMLEPHEAMLVFMLHAHTIDNPEEPFPQYGGSWAFSITADDVRPLPLPDRSLVHERVSIYRGLFERRDDTNRVAAGRLYDDLLDKALGHLPESVTRLVIIPDAVLGELPFEALRLPSGEFVAQRFEVSYAPSATLWSRWRDDPPSGGGLRGVLGMADPSPGPTVGEATGRNAGFLPEGLQLGALPHAAREAEAMVEHLMGNGRLLAGTAATERALKRLDLSEFDVLHLAAHAIVDESHPDRSAIVLVGSEGDEDGLLQIHEIVNLDLEDTLVVLSACQSAGGEAVFGEGIMSLARAFFEAGARTVVGSLLPLRDDETAELMDVFSRGLADGASVAGALTRARRVRIEAGLPPAAWAGLIVLGDGDLVPRPRDDSLDRKRLRLTVGVGGMLAVGLMLVVALRARRTPIPRS